MWQTLIGELTLRPWRELLFRAGHAALGRVGFWQWRDRQLPPAAPTRVELIYPIPDQARASSATQQEEVLARAKQLAEGCVTAFDVTWKFPLDRGVPLVNWHHALTTDTQWPDRGHWAGLDIRRLTATGQHGDIKYCWEWNRHADFLILAQAYLCTSDERWVDLAVSLIESWCRQVRVGEGIHWTSNMEVGLRALNWLQADATFRRSPSYRSAAQAKVVAHVLAAGRHLQAHLFYSRHAAPHNHLLADAACLAIIGMCVTGCSDAKKWRANGLATLTRGLRAQVLPDGMLRELSPSYHLLVLELLQHVKAVAQTNGFSLPPLIQRYAGQMAAVVADLRQPDGTLPDMNDNDDGMIPDLAALQGPRSPKRVSVALLKASIPDKKNGDHLPSIDVSHLPAAGLLRANYGTDWLLFDSHSDPYPHSGHNHASLLQVLLWVDGKPLLRDAGTFGYNSTGPWRDAFRGTAAHSTLVINQHDQAQPTRTFGWAGVTKPGRIEYSLSRGALVAHTAHASYFKWIHERTIVWLLEEQLWVISDLVRPVRGRSKSIVAIDRYWHFPGEYFVSETNQTCFSVKYDDRPWLNIHLRCHRPMPTRLVRGGDETHWAWESLAYGHRQPRWSIQASSNTILPVRSLTIISKSECQPPTVEWLSPTACWVTTATRQWCWR